MSYKLLGQGSFGIVITPPLNIHKTKKLNYVSKIIKKKINKKSKKNNNYKKNNEFNISKKLSKIKNAELWRTYNNKRNVKIFKSEK